MVEFEENFEGVNPLSNFDEVIQEYGTVSVATTNSIRGLKALHCVSPLNANARRVCVRKVVSTRQEIYARAYYRVNSLGGDPTQISLLGVFQTSTTSPYFAIVQIKTGRALKVVYRSGASYITQDLGAVLDVGKQYCIELYVKKGTGADGIVAVWLNGTLLWSITTNDFTQLTDITNLRFGLMYVNPNDVDVELDADLTAYNTTAIGLTPYLTKDAILSELDTLVSLYPTRITKESIGKTELNNDIWVYYIGTGTGKVEIDCAIHGRERVNTEMILVFAKWLVLQQDVDALDIFVNNKVAIIPIINYDKYNVQRKNANNVDLNRNFPYAWGGGCSSGNPGDFNYRGPSALSEAEAQVVYNFLVSWAPAFCISLHSGLLNVLKGQTSGAIATELTSWYNTEYAPLAAARGQSTWPFGTSGQCGQLQETVNNTLATLGVLNETHATENSPPPEVADIHNTLFPKWQPLIISAAQHIPRGPVGPGEPVSPHTSLFEVFKWTKFHDEVLRTWALTNCTRTIENDDIAKFVIVTDGGYADKTGLGGLTNDYSKIAIRITELLNANWSVSVMFSDSTWQTVFNQQTGIGLFIGTLTAGKTLSLIRLTFHGSVGGYVKVDYVLTCNATVLNFGQIGGTVKRRFTTEISGLDIEAFYSAAVAEVTPFSDVKLWLDDAKQFTGKVFKPYKSYVKGGIRRQSLECVDYGFIAMKRNTEENIENVTVDVAIKQLVQPLVDEGLMTYYNVEASATLVSKDFTDGKTTIFEAVKEICQLENAHYDFGWDFAADLHAFDRGTKSSGVTLTNSEILEGKYYLDVSAVINKQIVFGVVGKVKPDDDSLTETTSGWYNAIGSGSSITLESVLKKVGSYSIRYRATTVNQKVCIGRMNFDVDCTQLRSDLSNPYVHFWLYRQFVGPFWEIFPKQARVYLATDSSNYYYVDCNAEDVPLDQWKEWFLYMGPGSRNFGKTWSKYGTPDWKHITRFALEVTFGQLTEVDVKLLIDELHFAGFRFGGSSSDTASQIMYGLQEGEIIVKDELTDDTMCTAHAAAIVARFKNPPKRFDPLELDYEPTLKPGFTVLVNIAGGFSLSETLIVHENDFTFEGADLKSTVKLGEVPVFLDTKVAQMMRQYRNLQWVDVLTWKGTQRTMDSFPFRRTLDNLKPWMADNLAGQLVYGIVEGLFSLFGWTTQREQIVLQGEDIAGADEDDYPAGGGSYTTRFGNLAITTPATLGGGGFAWAWLIALTQSIPASRVSMFGMTGRMSPFTGGGIPSVYRFGVGKAHYYSSEAREGFYGFEVINNYLYALWIGPSYWNYQYIGPLSANTDYFFVARFYPGDRIDFFVNDGLVYTAITDIPTADFRPFTVGGESGVAVSTPVQGTLTIKAFNLGCAVPEG